MTDGPNPWSMGDARISPRSRAAARAFSLSSIVSLLLLGAAATSAASAPLLEGDLAGVIRAAAAPVRAAYARMRPPPRFELYDLDSSGAPAGRPAAVPKRDRPE